MELTKKLPESLTGGKPIISTTIVTENKVFVPILPELNDYFYIKDESSLKFVVHFDKVTGNG